MVSRPFTNKAALEQELAHKNTAHMNQGYKLLKNTVQRAELLLHLCFLTLTPQLSVSILMEQFDLHEKIAALPHKKLVLTLQNEIVEKIEGTEEEFHKRIIFGISPNKERHI